MELKPLLEHLKYAHLGAAETLPVIVAADLTPTEEDKLLRVLRKYQDALGWTIADIKSISPAICMHRILMEDDVKPTIDAQRRLNPIMKEVVRTEVMKLLDAGMIYPISDSKWVSPTQVVPKRTGITIVKNDNNELIPTRLTTSWRMCVDYRKPNAGTRKDHFPLPFTDQMLERLAGRAFYCFFGWLFWVQSDPNCNRGSGEDNFYMSIWDICLSEDAIWVMQCTCHFSGLYDEYLFWLG